MEDKNIRTILDLSRKILGDMENRGIKHPDEIYANMQILIGTLQLIQEKFIITKGDKNDQKHQLERFLLSESQKQ